MYQPTQGFWTSSGSGGSCGEGGGGGNAVISEAPLIVVEFIETYC